MAEMQSNVGRDKLRSPSAVDLAWMNFARATGAVSRRLLGIEFDQLMALGCRIIRRFENSSYVSLTIDDSPQAETTDSILAALDAHSVKSTFFCIGEHVRRHPAVLRSIVAAGHEIGNHTEHHLDLHRVSPGRLQREIRQCQQTISDACGVEPRIFRAPFGHFRWEMRYSRSGGLDALAGWDVGPPVMVFDPETIASWVIEHAVGGSIIVLHDGLHGVEQRTSELAGQAVAASLPLFIPALQRRGLTFRTLGQQLSERPI